MSDFIRKSIVVFLCGILLILSPLIVLGLYLYAQIYQRIRLRMGLYQIQYKKNYDRLFKRGCCCHSGSKLSSLFYCNGCPWLGNGPVCPKQTVFIAHDSVTDGR